MDTVIKLRQISRRVLLHVYVYMFCSSSRYFIFLMTRHLSNLQLPIKDIDSKRNHGITGPISYISTIYLHFLSLSKHNANTTELQFHPGKVDLGEIHRMHENPEILS